MSTFLSRVRSWAVPFQTWHWALVPLLAIVAYYMVLGVGFLMDDYRLLTLAQEPGIDGRALLPFDSSWVPPKGFYRPVGALFTWELGWELWGFNPVPYHFTGLLLHSGCALALGLWLAGATGRRGLGWLAGALFAVFPAHLEAVAWLAAQWDALATLLGILSLWAFTTWWHSGRRNRWFYTGSVLLYGLAIFTKESLFTFVAVLGVAAWYVSPPPPNGWRAWGRLALALAPFGLPIAINIGLRFAIIGELGNYPTARGDIGSIVWDSLIAYVRVLLAPINPAVLGGAWVQITGALVSLALLVGMAVWGRAQARLLLLAGAWVVITLAPALNSPFLVNRDDLQNNRYLYLPAAGYCVGVAALMYTGVVWARRWRPMLVGSVALVILAGAGLSWVQLQPWVQSGMQAREITRSLLSLIPPQPRQNGMVWYVENLPYTYKGAYMLYIGLGLARVLTYGGGDYPNILRLPEGDVETAAEAPLADESRDAFAFRLAYDVSDDLYHVDYISGVTKGDTPPATSDGGSGLKVWDFRDCAQATINAWTAFQATAKCTRGSGLLIEPEGSDPQLYGSNLDIPIPTGTYVRLRAAVSYPLADRSSSLRSEWLWHAQENDFAPERVRIARIKRDGKHNVYWTFLRADEVGEKLSQLRFDPVDAKVSATIAWLAVDVVR
jgi:hypothetical protein